jgi:hypothetical protein
LKQLLDAAPSPISGSESFIVSPIATTELDESRKFVFCQTLRENKRSQQKENYSF